jgi:hypothetical protein
VLSQGGEQIGLGLEGTGLDRPQPGLRIQVGEPAQPLQKRPAAGVTPAGQFGRTGRSVSQGNHATGTGWGAMGSRALAEGGQRLKKR